MAALLALLASLSWGTSDFLGGTASRRIAPTTVVFGSQGFALVGVAVVAVFTRAWTASPGYLGWSLVAAGCGVVALSAFYRALSLGRMGVVAPIAALGVGVPVAVGLVQGEHPSLAQSVGVAVAIVGVVMASGPEIRGPSVGRLPVMLAIVAAVGFGVVILCVAHGARSSTVMTLLTMRAASVGVLGLAGAIGRVTLRVPARDLPLLAVIGAGDVGANALFAVASTRGLLAVVAVLSSLYPAVTVLLARLVHAERLRPVQNAGVVAALVGVVLLAAG